VINPVIKLSIIKAFSYSLKISSVKNVKDSAMKPQNKAYKGSSPVKPSKETLK